MEFISDCTVTLPFVRISQALDSTQIPLSPSLSQGHRAVLRGSGAVWRHDSLHHPDRRDAQQPHPRPQYLLLGTHRGSSTLPLHVAGDAQGLLVWWYEVLATIVGCTVMGHLIISCQVPVFNSFRYEKLIAENQYNI